MFIVPIMQMTPPQLIQTERPQSIENGKQSSPFQQIFQDVLSDMKETQAIADKDAYDLAMGDVDDLHTVVINSEKAATALELTVQMTTRAISAYNEIMRMQV